MHVVCLVKRDTLFQSKDLSLFIMPSLVLISPMAAKSGLKIQIRTLTRSFHFRNELFVPSHFQTLMLILALFSRTSRSSNLWTMLRLTIVYLFMTISTIFYPLATTIISLYYLTCRSLAPRLVSWDVYLYQNIVQLNLD